MISEMTKDFIPNAEWLGWWDSREYLQDTDKDYILKHFFLCLENNNLRLIIVNELSESFEFQSEGENNWTCFTQEDYETLKDIMIKSLQPLIVRVD